LTKIWILDFLKLEKKRQQKTGLSHFITEISKVIHISYTLERFFGLFLENLANLYSPLAEEKEDFAWKNS